MNCWCLRHRPGVAGSLGRTRWKQFALVLVHRLYETIFLGFWLWGSYIAGANAEPRKLHYGSEAPSSATLAPRFNCWRSGCQGGHHQRTLRLWVFPAEAHRFGWKHCRLDEPNRCHSSCPTQRPDHPTGARWKRWSNGPDKFQWVRSNPRPTALQSRGFNHLFHYGGVQAMSAAEFRASPEYESLSGNEILGP